MKVYGIKDMDIKWGKNITELVDIFLENEENKKAFKNFCREYKIDNSQMDAKEFFADHFRDEKTDWDGYAGLLATAMNSKIFSGHHIIKYNPKPPYILYVTEDDDVKVNGIPVERRIINNTFDKALSRFAEGSKADYIEI